MSTVTEHRRTYYRILQTYSSVVKDVRQQEGFMVAPKAPGLTLEEFKKLIEWLDLQVFSAEEVFASAWEEDE